jgi:hypothetical protein
MLGHPTGVEARRLDQLRVELELRDPSPGALLVEQAPEFALGGRLNGGRGRRRRRRLLRPSWQKQRGGQEDGQQP